MQVRARVEDEKKKKKKKKNGVVITGGTKGLGYSLAREFLARDEKVVICGRNKDRLHAAVNALQDEYHGATIHGIQCDVSSPSDVAALASFAVAELGTVHFWINNAGIYVLMFLCSYMHTYVLRFQIFEFVELKELSYNLLTSLVSMYLYVEESMNSQIQITFILK
jgi:NAD(P)-dependent dehydrogenase (short-subunit alcohol dehydrogenase family)